MMTLIQNIENSFLAILEFNKCMDQDNHNHFILLDSLWFGLYKQIDELVAFNLLI